MNDNNSKNSGRLIQVMGWIGALLVLVAYILVSFNVINNHQGLYQILNLIGALGIAVETYSRRDYQPVVVNIIWALVAIFALLSLIK